MDEFIDLLRQYLSKTISPAAFQKGYFEFRRAILNEHDQAVKSVPGLHEAFIKVEELMWKRWISSSEFEKRYRELLSQVPKTQIITFSEEDKLISDLFTPVEHYTSNPVLRRHYGSTDEVQMRAEIIEVLNRHKTVLAKYGLQADLFTLP